MSKSDDYRTMSIPAHVENLKPGQFIAVIRQNEPTVKMSPFGPVELELKCDGYPYRIDAISLPFVCVRDFTDHTFAIDIREFDVRRVSRTYAMAMYSGSKPGKKRIAEDRRKSSLIVEPHPNDCPQCHNRMVRRRTVGCPDFVLHCKECGFERPMGPNLERQ